LLSAIRVVSSSYLRLLIFLPAILIPADLFQILKDDAVKLLYSNASKFEKLSSGHRTGKGQFSLQSQRKAMSRNV